MDLAHSSICKYLGILLKNLHISISLKFETNTFKLKLSISYTLSSPSNYSSPEHRRDLHKNQSKLLLCKILFSSFWSYVKYFLVHTGIWIGNVGKTLFLHDSK